MTPDASPAPVIPEQTQCRCCAGKGWVWSFPEPDLVNCDNCKQPYVKSKAEFVRFDVESDRFQNFCGRACATAYATKYARAQMELEANARRKP